MFPMIYCFFFAILSPHTFLWALSSFCTDFLTLQIFNESHTVYLNPLLLAVSFQYGLCPERELWLMNFEHYIEPGALAPSYFTINVKNHLQMEVL